MSPAHRFAFLLMAGAITVTACDQPTSTATAPNNSITDNAAETPDLGFTGQVGGPFSNLTAAERRQFFRGNVIFNTVFKPATGLGPLFNSASCASCHNIPVVGGSGIQVETHQTAFHGGTCDDLEEIGGQVIQDSVTPALRAALGISKEPLLAEANGTGHRTTPSILGFGLLEAVPDSVILSHADPDDRDHDGVAGRAAVEPDGRVGRFGRKANAATLEAFQSGAFIYEMGITNPLEPDEQTIHGAPLPAGVDPTADPELSQAYLDATTVFTELLAPPSPARFNLLALEGRRTFGRIGCASCHIPSLPTGSTGGRAVRNKVVRAYSDLLLHDMGSALADICLGQATPSEFRTEPLMGLRFRSRFLHDGRAATIADAIRMHGGEGTGASNRFSSLSGRQRDELLRFLRSL